MDELETPLWASSLERKHLLASSVDSVLESDDSRSVNLCNALLNAENATNICCAIEKLTRVFELLVSLLSESDLRVTQLCLSLIGEIIMSQNEAAIEWFLRPEFVELILSNKFLSDNRVSMHVMNICTQFIITVDDVALRDEIAAVFTLEDLLKRYNSTNEIYAKDVCFHLMLVMCLDPIDGIDEVIKIAEHRLQVETRVEERTRITRVISDLVKSGYPGLIVIPDFTELLKEKSELFVVEVLNLICVMSDKGREIAVNIDQLMSFVCSDDTNDSVRFHSARAIHHMLSDEQVVDRLNNPRCDIIQRLLVAAPDFTTETKFHVFSIILKCAASMSQSTSLECYFSADEDGGNLVEIIGEILDMKNLHLNNLFIPAWDRIFMLSESPFSEDVQMRFIELLDNGELFWENFIVDDEALENMATEFYEKWFDTA